MLKRFVKRLLQRCGIRLPFTDVICAEHLKSIAIGPEGLSKVTVRKKLVFLDVPEMGDLHDICPIEGEATLDNFMRHSPDSIEGGRRRIGSTAVVIDWMPAAAVSRYTLYEHEYSWFPAGSQLQPALFTEYVCDAKTGHFVCELMTPEVFEAAVVFERPRWPSLNTERRVMQYALKQIRTGACARASATTAGGSNGGWPSRKSAAATCAWRSIRTAWPAGRTTSSGIPSPGASGGS